MLLGFCFKVVLQGSPSPVDNFWTVVGESPDCLLLSGTVVGENPAMSAGRSPDIHDLSEYHRLYDLGRHTEQPKAAPSCQKSFNNKKHVHHGFLAPWPYLCSTSLTLTPKKYPRDLWRTTLNNKGELIAISTP